jgi:uncharacterized protein DUF3617
MKISRIALIIAGLSVSVIANAAPGLKPGQWDMAVKVDMPEMPKLSAAQMAQMKQMGIKMPAAGEPMHVQQCITPAQASLKEPINTSQGKDGCVVKNYRHSGNTASGDMVCNGDFKGTGRFEMTLNGDTSYSSKWSMKGIAKGGQPFNQSSESSGTWVKAACDAGIAGNIKQ